MKAYNSHEKRALLYAISDTDGTPLDLMNVQSFKEGELDSVATFIGRRDRDEYVKIADAVNLSNPGTVFNYSRFVRQQERFIGEYLRIYHRNLAGKVHTGGNAHYAAGRELTPEDELIDMLRQFHTQR